MTGLGRVLLIGSGGHARVVLGLLRVSGAEVVGVLTRDAGIDVFEGVAVWGGDADLIAARSRADTVAIGIGGATSTEVRKRVQREVAQAGFGLPALVHPRAFVDPTAKLGGGVQVMAGAVVQPGAVIGEGCLINTGACVDHDVALGAFVHVAPGAVLAGGVIVEDGAVIGPGAVVSIGRRIGAVALIAAGAVVLDDVAAGARVAGVPARLIGKGGSR